VSFELGFGSVEHSGSQDRQWLELNLTKSNRDRFRVWILCEGYPPRELKQAERAVVRYIVQEGQDEPVEYRDRFSGRAVLPVLGAWEYLFPQAAETPTPDRFPAKVSLLGHEYDLESAREAGAPLVPPPSRVLDLTSEALIGIPHNTRQTDDQRRYDGSDYKLVRLIQADYEQMIQAGMNCFNADPEQRHWLERRPVYYWGGGVADLPYPEILYRSSYLGPNLFMDEPAVGTRDYVLRPRLQQDATLAHRLTPQLVLAEFKEHFRKAKEAAGIGLTQALAARADVDLGNMRLNQQNLFTWETMISTGAYQLTADGQAPPSAIVFEPPGHVGTKRTLPEMDMVYGCQIPTDAPANLTGIICGLLRGAARLSGRDWGISIYGAVDPADSPLWLTRSYDLGARFFFFWSTSGLACVPFDECLTLSRHLRTHIERHPVRDLGCLQHSAEVLVLFPPGYNLGHVHLGKGSLWGLPELNLERTNQFGVTYRSVMHNLFAHIERCIRLGVEYDLAWDLPGIDVQGYREIIHIRENGEVQVYGSSESSYPATPLLRPAGTPPELKVHLSVENANSPSHQISARSEVVEGSAPLFYTPRANSHGQYENDIVFWELFGPADENYRSLLSDGARPEINRKDTRHLDVTIKFSVAVPGHYRLRAATVDRAGRSAVAWENFEITE
jgi:hypothetical protein